MRKKPGVGQALLVLFLTLYGRVQATDSPLEMIRTTTEQALAVLRDPSYQDAHHRQERTEKLKEIILPQFDPWEIARRSLGIYWNERTQEEKKTFARLFIRLLEKTYGSLLDRYKGDLREVHFLFDGERIESNFAEVDTRILTPTQDKPFAVTYRLHRVNGKWLVYDIVIENVSMVSSYRNQFSRIMNKSSFEGLVRALERKLKQLEDTPS